MQQVELGLSGCFLRCVALVGQDQLQQGLVVRGSFIVEQPGHFLPSETCPQPEQIAYGHGPAMNFIAAPAIE